MTARTQMFSYEALGADGLRQRGRIAAPDENQALHALRDRGLLPVAVRTAAGRSQSRLTARDAAAGLSILAELMQTGMPLNRAMAVFRHVAPAAWGPMLPHIEEALRAGASLSRALDTIPGAIPAGAIAIIAAEEHGGMVASGLRRAAGLLEQAAATRSAILSALAYPAVLAVAGMASVSLLVAVVIPRFAAILADLGQTLPPASRFVMGAGAAARTLLLPALIASVLAVLLGRAWIRHPVGALRWHTFLLAVPLIGRIRRDASTGRVCTTAAAMIAGGVPLPRAMAFAADAGGDVAVRERLLAARREVVAGKRVSQACAETDAMPPAAIQLIRAGEESGTLAAMLERAGQIHQDQAVGRTKVLVRLLEPALILGFAAMIGAVAAALFQAMYAVRVGG